MQFATRDSTYVLTALLQGLVFMKKFPSSKHQLALVSLASISCALTLGPKDTDSSLGAQPHYSRHLPMALWLDLASSKPCFLSDRPCWLTAWTHPEKERFLPPTNQSPQGKSGECQIHNFRAMKIQKGQLTLPEGSGKTSHFITPGNKLSRRQNRLWLCLAFFLDL